MKFVLLNYTVDAAIMPLVGFAFGTALAAGALPLLGVAWLAQRILN